MTRNAPAWIGFAALFAAACYFAVVQGYGGAMDGASTAARLATGIGFLIVIAGAAMLGLRAQVSIALRQTVAWFAVLLAGAVIFAYRAEFYDVGGPMLAKALQIRVVADGPYENGSANASEGGWAAGDRAVISAGRGGQFFVEAMIDGSHVQLVADTGATLVALTAEDAQRVGINFNELDFRHRHRTANGVARAAHVILDEIAIGPVTVNNVRASVSEPGLLHVSLLGMSYLSQLTSFQVRGDQLVLQQ